MEKTKRVVWGLIGLAVCGCMICGPTPMPMPEPEQYWDPVGAPSWPDASVQLKINPELQQGFAGQGADVRHLELEFTVAREVLGSATDVRVLMLATRSNGTTVFRNSALRTFASANLQPGTDAGYSDLAIARICPARDPGPVIDELMHWTVQFARESDRQLLQRIETDLAPVCPSGSCPCR